jgi:hypothetical protein
MTIPISVPLELIWLIVLILPIFAVTYQKFETFVGDIGLQVHELNADALKVYATDNAPDPGLDSVKADLLEITAQFGYPSGGTDYSGIYAEASGTGTLTGTNVTWTAAGGVFGPLRYIVNYNDAPAGPVDPLINWWDRGASVTIQDGESFTVNFGANIFTFA